MRSTYRTQDYHKIKTERDGLYYAAGIPRSYWSHKDTSMPSFTNASVKEDSPPVTKKTQEEWYKRMIEGDFFDSPLLFLIISPDEDMSSLRVGYNILKFALESKPMIRTHITESSKHWAKSSEEKVFLLSNVYDDAPKERIQNVRDWSTNHGDSFRIICAAGDPQILRRRSKLYFNAVFQVNPYTETTVTSF